MPGLQVHHLIKFNMNYHTYTFKALGSILCAAVGILYYQSVGVVNVRIRDILLVADLNKMSPNSNFVIFIFNFIALICLLILFKASKLFDLDNTGRYGILVRAVMIFITAIGSAFIWQDLTKLVAINTNINHNPADTGQIENYLFSFDTVSLEALATMIFVCAASSAIFRYRYLPRWVAMLLLFCSIICVLMLRNLD